MQSTSTSSETLERATAQNFSAEFEALYLQDLHAHGQPPAVGSAEYIALRENDLMRRQRAKELLAACFNPTAGDLFHAAWLFNHGDRAEDAHFAHQLATQASALGHEAGKWLSAASFDRWQMYSGKPQKYGTQIVPDGVRYRVWDVDPETSDAERAMFNVPRLVEQHQRAERLTATQAQPPLDEAPGWLKEAIERWKSGPTELRAT